MSVNWEVVNEIVGEPYHCPTCGKEFDNLLRLKQGGDHSLAVLTHEGMQDCFGDSVVWLIETDCCNDIFKVEAKAWNYEESRFFWPDDEERWNEAQGSQSGRGALAPVPLEDIS